MKKKVIFLVITTLLFVLPIKFSCFRPKNTLIEKLPTTVIKSRKSRLHRPEGIAFSPTGEFIAAANSTANTISFYQCLSAERGVYETTPFFTLRGAQTALKYPHDLSFSPDGSHLAVANREGNSVTIYKKGANSLLYNPIPIAIIQGSTSHLEEANAIKYVPHENMIAVANCKGNTIAFYRYQGEVYEQSPCQIIQHTNGILNRPDGIAFSSDGELLAVTSHGNHSVVFYQKVSDTQNFYSPDPVEILQGKKSNLHFPHSLCFHPSGNYLVVSNASGKNTLNIFKKNSETFPRYTFSPWQTLRIYNPKTFHLQKKYPEEGGIKGVAFSPNGKYLSVCASEITKVFKSILFYPLSERSLTCMRPEKQSKFQGKIE